MNDYIYHHGVVGMKWGVRKKSYNDSSDRSSKKKAKKEVNQLHKALNGTVYGQRATSMASMSKISKNDYEKAATLMDQGRLVANGRFKKNLEKKAVDLYIGKSKDPVMRATMKNGNEFVLEFLNKHDQQNYSDFMKYYEKR